MTEPRKRREAEHTEPSAEPLRVFMDDEGTRWQVREQAFSEYDRRHGRSLIFASDAAVRRVRDYPANWHELTDEELVALSWKA